MGSLLFLILSPTTLSKVQQAPATLAVFVHLERQASPHLWEPESAIPSSQSVSSCSFTDQLLDIQGSAQISSVHQLLIPSHHCTFFWALFMFV